MWNIRRENSYGTPSVSENVTKMASVSNITENISNICFVITVSILSCWSMIQQLSTVRGINNMTETLDSCRKDRGEEGGYLRCRRNLWGWEIQMYQRPSIFHGTSTVVSAAAHVRSFATVKSTWKIHCQQKSCLPVPGVILFVQKLASDSASTTALIHVNFING